MQIATTINNLFMVMGIGVAVAASIVVGNQIGSGDEEKAIEYKSIQTTWEEHIEEFVFSDAIVLDETTLGSSFEWQQLSILREQYKNRAIYLKYLIYLNSNKKYH